MLKASITARSAVAELNAAVRLIPKSGMLLGREKVFLNPRFVDLLKQD